MELVPLLFIAIMVIVLLVLPMRQRNRAMQQARMLQESLTPGTEVMTTSGLFGTVVSVAEETVELEIADGVVVRWAKPAIAEVRTGTAAVPDPAVDNETG
jgi:preprotein translocase subunit YajC